MRPILRIALVCSFALPFAACEPDQDRAVADAQSCIDSAVAATAPTCVAMVAGIESSAAYAIRCSAHYIVNGVTGARFAGAFQSIKDNSSTTSPLTAAFGYLSFSATSGADGSDQTLADCQKSEVPSLARIALLTSTATLLRTATGATVAPAADGSIDAAQMKTIIQQFSGSPSALGNLAIQVNSSFCAAGSSLESNKVCTDLSGAIQAGAGDPSTIGTQLLTLLQN